MEATDKTTEVMVVFSDENSKVILEITESPNEDSITRNLSIQFMPEIKSFDLLSPAQTQALVYFNFLKNQQGE